MIPELIKKWAPEFTDRKADLSKISFQFAMKLAAAHPREFVGGIVWGPKRWGKSIYALKVAMQVFVSMGCTQEEAWGLALASLFFHPRALLETLGYINKNGFTWPILILDDAGKAAGSHVWFTDRATYYALRDVFDTIGDPISGFIATTPNFEKLLDVLRGDLSCFRIEITKVHGREWDRIANAYLIKQLHSGKIRVKSKRDKEGGFVDEFSAHLSDDKYTRYFDIRRGFTGEAIDFALARYGPEEEISPPDPQISPRASRPRASTSERVEYQPSPPSPPGPGRSLLSKRASSDEYDETHEEST